MLVRLAAFQGRSVGGVVEANLGTAHRIVDQAAEQRADSSYFETAATMAYRGASVVFSPHFNRIPQQGLDAHRLRVRHNHIGLAALLDVYVVRANVVHADDPQGPGYGDSAIFAPDGRPVAEAGLFREALIVADADLAPDRAAGRSRLRERVPHAVRRLLTAAMDAYPSADW